MKVIGALAAALGMAGRHGTLLAGTSKVVRLAIPDLAAVCKPFLGEAIVVMLTLAFLRVDPADLRGHWARPELIAAATAWTMLIVPAVLGMVFLAFRLGQHMPGLYFMLVLQMSAPGLMSSPAFAALLGLDVALTLATLIISTAITPLTASFFTYIYLGTAVVSPLAFGLKLFLIIAGCALAATIIRRVTGQAFLEAQRERIDGLSVLAMSTFAIAAMDGVVDHFRADPLLVIELVAPRLCAGAWHDRTCCPCFLRVGRASAFAIGLIAGNRNVGLMLAATGFAVPDIAWLYFALVQLPIYLLPHLLKPLAKRLSSNR